MIISFQNCLSKGKCGTGDVGDGKCNYDPIGIVERTCDYTQFDKDVAKRLNKNCSASDVEGSFTYCNNLLKDHFAVASNCSCGSPMTTMVSCLWSEQEREFQFALQMFFIFVFRVLPSLPQQTTALAHLCLSHPVMLGLENAYIII